MAKENNLTDFLTDVADAIREKKGTTEKINPQDFSDEIRGIESGGGIIPCEWNDVNFYDYDGTILYSYTWDEFVEKNEMPPLPTHHKGLVCQEWNYTLEEVLEQGGRCDVGAIYIPEDGNTRIKLETLGNVEYTICLKASEIGGAEIDWGDGVVTTSTSTELTYYSHIYTNAGRFIIRIITKKGTIDDFGIKNTVNSYQDVQEVNIGGNIKSLAIEAFRYIYLQVVSIPNYLSVGPRLFYNPLYKSIKIVGVKHLNIPRIIYGSSFALCEQMAGLTSVSIPNSFTTNQYMFAGLSSLPHLHIPSNCNVEKTTNSYSLRYISSSVKNTSVSTDGNVLIINDVLYTGGFSAFIPNGVKTISTNAFAYKEQLKEIDIPESVTDIEQGAFNYCTGLTRFNIPSGVTILNSNTFGKLFSMTTPIVIPPSVNTINTYCFEQTTNTICFDFSQHTSIPTLKSINAFTNSGNWKIVVPDALYDQWIAATNWSTYASRIVKASEFVEPTNE